MPTLVAPPGGTPIQSAIQMSACVYGHWYVPHVTQE